jgi:hypothetical protein
VTYVQYDNNTIAPTHSAAEMGKIADGNPGVFKNPDGSWKVNAQPSGDPIFGPANQIGSWDTGTVFH